MLFFSGMPKCGVCDAETELFIAGDPVCLTCADLPGTPASSPDILVSLERAEHTARADVGRAKSEFQQIASENPQPFEHPGRLHQAAVRVRCAEQKLRDASHQLSAFLAGGVLPEELEN